MLSRARAVPAKSPPSRREDEQPKRASAADLDALSSHRRTYSATATPKRVKGEPQAMIDGIHMDARDQIELAFRVHTVCIEWVS
jgi:hypothetical protein